MEHSPRNACLRKCPLQTDVQTDGHADGTKFIGPLSALPVVQNLQKHVKNPNAIQACQHCNTGNHRFNAHAAKFILIEKL